MEFAATLTSSCLLMPCSTLTRMVEELKAGTFASKAPGQLGITTGLMSHSTGQHSSAVEVRGQLHS